MTEVTPHEAKRIKSFAGFFKSYMSVSSMIVALLPIPVTSFNLLPVFEQQKGVFSVYTSMFCFLLLAYVFYIRHTLARILFPLPETSEKDGAPRRSAPFLVAIVPVFCIITSLMCAMYYHTLVNEAVVQVRRMISTNKPNDLFMALNINSKFPNPEKADYNYILKNFQISAFEKSSTLMMYYFGIFLFAELAFILMAIKEYLQDVIGLTDKQVIYPLKPGIGDTLNSSGIVKRTRKKTPLEVSGV